MKKLILTVAAALLALSAPVGEALGAKAEPREIFYRIDMASPRSGLLPVSLEVQAKASPLVLEMTDSYGDGLAVNLSSHIRDEAATDASGAPLTVRREGDAWYVDGAGDITFSYTVDVSGYQAGTDYLASLAGEGEAWPYFPILDADLAWLPGYAVFIRPADGAHYRPTLELEMPSRWRAVLPWAEQPSGLEDLLFNPIYAGELVMEEKGAVLAALPAAAAAAQGSGLAEYASKAASLLTATEGMLSSLNLPEGGKLPVMLLFRGEGKGPSEALYPSLPFTHCAVLAAPASTDVLSDEVLEATAKSMVDNWLAENLPTAEEASWFRSGSAWYLQYLIPYRAGIWGAQTFWDRFYSTYEAYRMARGGYEGTLAASALQAAEDADAASLLPLGGASACAAIDSELRSIKAGEFSLVSLLRDLAVLRAGETPLGNADIQAFLESASGRDWGYFFRNYVVGAQEIPASSFSALNVAPTEGNNLPAEIPQGSASTSDWILLAIAVLVVFAIPFVLEPFTISPRKPGFLRKKLGKDEEDEEDGEN